MKRYRLELKANDFRSFATVKKWRRRCFATVKAAEDYIVSNTPGDILFSGEWILVERKPSDKFPGAVYDDPIWKYPHNVTSVDIWKRKEYIGKDGDK